MLRTFHAHILDLATLWSMTSSEPPKQVSINYEFIDSDAVNLFAGLKAKITWLPFLLKFRRRNTNACKACLKM